MFMLKESITHKNDHSCLLAYWIILTQESCERGLFGDNSGIIIPPANFVCGGGDILFSCCQCISSVALWFLWGLSKKYRLLTFLVFFLVLCKKETYMHSLEALGKSLLMSKWVHTTYIFHGEIKKKKTFPRIIIKYTPLPSPLMFITGS